VTRAATTGGDGFLGWHTQCALREAGTACADIPVGDFFDPEQALAAVDGADRFIHLAGVNRGSDEEVADGNRLFAEQMATTLRRASRPPSVVVYANSIQASLDNTYGRAKAAAADVLRAAAADVGAQFVDVRFPNLFGEHGRPFYNSVTATFCHLLAQGGSPQVVDDKELTLLHAQDAADVLIGAVDPDRMGSLAWQETVSGLAGRLGRMAEAYRAGEIPDVSVKPDRDLFNTYRSYAPVAGIGLAAHADARGAFVEIVRARGGQGQTSFSTTVPGVTRGDHFHRRKIERFVVLSGQAVIRLRRVGTDDVVCLPVSGDEPVAVDMPTMWAHNITNVGQEPLYTAFWADELFDPARPDTIAERV